MSKRFRYAYQPRSTRRSVHLRHHQDPTEHEKYYAFLKHRAQARYRGEPYDLTWAQWQRLWPQKLWNRRGRAPHSVRLTQIDPTQGWCEQNCVVRQHSAHMREINRRRRDTRTTAES